jgi:hypothetical protein
MIEIKWKTHSIGIEIVCFAFFSLSFSLSFVWLKVNIIERVSRIEKIRGHFIGDAG